MLLQTGAKLTKKRSSEIGAPAPGPHAGLRPWTPVGELPSPRTSHTPPQLPVLLYWVLVLVLDVYLSTFFRYWYWYWYWSLRYWYLYWYLLV